MIWNQPALVAAGVDAVDAPPESQPLLPDTIGGRAVLSTSTAQWSPHGNHVAVAAQLAAGSGRRDVASQVIAIVSPDTGDLHVVWEESGAVPFVLRWSPDGKRLALLATQSQPELILEVLLFGDGPEPFATAASRMELVRSAPVYFDWSTDSETLVVASGGAVTSYDTDSGTASTLVTGNGDSRAPDAGAVGDGVLAIEGRGAAQTIVELDPGGRRLPHLTAPAGGAPVRGALALGDTGRLRGMDDSGAPPVPTGTGLPGNAVTIL